ncbi:hypothetical protein D9M68_895050 [compost metagenome]
MEISESELCSRNAAVPVCPMIRKISCSAGSRVREYSKAYWDVTSATLPASKGRSSMRVRAWKMIPSNDIVPDAQRGGSISAASTPWMSKSMPRFAACCLASRTNAPLPVPMSTTRCLARRPLKRAFQNAAIPPS